MSISEGRLLLCVFHYCHKLFMHSYYFFLNLISKHYLDCQHRLSNTSSRLFSALQGKEIKIINHLQLQILMCISPLVSICFSDLHQTRGIYCIFLILIRLFFIFCILSEDRWFASLLKLFWICNGQGIIRKMWSKDTSGKVYTFVVNLKILVVLLVLCVKNVNFT